MIAISQPRSVFHDQPRTSRKSGITASMTSPSVRTSDAQPARTPAISSDHQAGRGFQSTIRIAIMSRKVKSVSVMIRCSSSMM